MKNLFFPMFFVLALLFFLANISEADIWHSRRNSDCAKYLQLRLQLAQSVKAICRCLKAGAKSLGVQDRFLSKIPGACKIKVGFPVSTSTNCETIN